MPRKNANPKARKKRAQLLQKAAKKNMRGRRHISLEGRELSNDPRRIAVALGNYFTVNSGGFVTR